MYLMAIIHFNTDLNQIASKHAMHFNYRWQQECEESNTLYILKKEDLWVSKPLFCLFEYKKYYLQVNL